MLLKKCHGRIRAPMLSLSTFAFLSVEISYLFKAALGYPFRRWLSRSNQLYVITNARKNNCIFMYARQILIFAYLRVYFSQVRKHVKSLHRNLIVTDFADEKCVERYCNGIFPFTIAAHWLILFNHIMYYYSTNSLLIFLLY